jgi:hypothetical protein
MPGDSDDTVNRFESSIVVDQYEFLSGLNVVVTPWKSYATEINAIRVIGSFYSTLECCWCLVRRPIAIKARKKSTLQGAK